MARASETEQTPEQGSRSAPCLFPFFSTLLLFPRFFPCQPRFENAAGGFGAQSAAAGLGAGAVPRGPEPTENGERDEQVDDRLQ